MFSRFKPGLKRLLLIAHLLVALLLVLSAFLPRLHPHQFRLSGLAGLPFLFLVGVSILFIPVWLLYRTRYYLISVGMVLLCIQPLSVSVGHHLFGAGAARDTSRSFRVMTFNASSFGLKQWLEDTAVQNNAYRTFQRAQPDVLCLQEFYSGTDTFRTNHLDSLKQTLGFNYCFYTDDHEFWNKVSWGIALYARYPILHARRIEVDTLIPGSGRSILEADLLVHHDTVRVYTVQLKSYMFNATDYNDIQRIKRLRDFTLGSTHHILSKMLHVQKCRAAETDTLHTLITASPFPVILCGDFNDVPVSYTYNVLSSGMRDAFLDQGWGIGRTYQLLAPNLRIDYILVDPRMECTDFNTFPHPLFEHVPMMATLSLPKH